MSEAAPKTFSALAVGVMIAVGVFAFSAFFVLSAYAPALRSGDDGGAHALSRSAVGYAALADFLDRTGETVIVSRSAPFSDGPETLTILTPTPGDARAEIPTAAHRTLIVLPKWRTIADPERPGWVALGPPIGRSGFDVVVEGHAGPLDIARRGDRRSSPGIREREDEDEDEAADGETAENGDAQDGGSEDGDGEAEDTVLERFGVTPDNFEFVLPRTTEPADIPINRQAFDFGPRLAPVPAPTEIEDVMSLQTVSGEHVEPVWQDEFGRIVLGRITVHPRSDDGGLDTDAYVPSQTYILADPDLLNTMGLARASNAQGAAALMAALSGGRPMRFDVTAFGFGRPQNLLTVALEPPFLAASLAGLFCALLLGIHATARFGPPEEEPVGFALGKAAIADNTAALLSASDKARTLGPAYASLVRGRIAAAMGLPKADHRLDERAARLLGGDALRDASGAAAEAGDTGALVAAARRLHEIKEGIEA